MKIECGGYFLEHSSSVIQIGNAPILITLPDEIEGDYRIELIFITVPNESTITRLKPIGQFHLQIEFVNFDMATNTGNVEPIEVGTLRNKKLFFVYRVTDLKDVGKMVHINFYTEKEASLV